MDEGSEPSRTRSRYVHLTPITFGDGTQSTAQHHQQHPASRSTPSPGRGASMLTLSPPPTMLNATTNANVGQRMRRSSERIRLPAARELPARASPVEGHSLTHSRLGHHDINNGRAPLAPIQRNGSGICRSAAPGSASGGSDAEDERAVRPHLRPPHARYTGVPEVDDDLWEPAKALRSLIAFDLSVEAKQAFEDFARQGNSKAVPGMIISYFKHFMCAQSPLVAALQALPLQSIEAVVGALSRSGTLAPGHFTRQVLEPLLGKHHFFEQDALALFDFFDTDSDGEIDFRDLCNGFVLLRSRDGPVVPVVHKCMLLVAPKTRREARLAMMTRLELLHLTNVLTSVLHDYVEHARAQTSLLKAAIDAEVPPVSQKGVEVRQLRAQEHDVKTLTALAANVQVDVQKMLETFSLDRRGNFPYSDVRAFMLNSAPIQHAISLMRVPRDDDLYRSFLSEFFRNAECDEASSSNREFRPLLRNKSVLLCGLQSTSTSTKASGLAARRQTFAKVNNNDRTEEEVTVDESREAKEHDDPQYFTLRGMLYRRPCAGGSQPPHSTGAAPPPLSATAPPVAAFVTKAEYFVEDSKGKRLKRF